MLIWARVVVAYNDKYKISLDYIRSYIKSHSIIIKIFAYNLNQGETMCLFKTFNYVIGVNLDFEKRAQKEQLAKYCSAGLWSRVPKKLAV